VYFIREQTLQTLELPAPFTLVIADTGIPSPTSLAVGDVRRLWQAQRGFYNALFEAIGGLVRAARHALEHGQPELLGRLMDANHTLLQQLTVSSPELDRLAAAARKAGASGAKLSGGGRGGNMIALVDAHRAEAVSAALLDSGAVHTIITRVAP
jgi:mevalonate kinase